MTRLEELKQQATEDILGVKVLNADIFAELIAKECANICDNHPAWTARMVGNQIRDNFGLNNE